MIHNISARGILKKDGKILFVGYKTSTGMIYALPGGGQKTGEGLKSTAKREFKEETCLDVEVGEVLLVREFMLTESEFEVWKDGIHQVEIIFIVTQINPEQTAEPGIHCDINMCGVYWLSEDDVKNLEVYPSREIFKIVKSRGISYLLN